MWTRGDHANSTKEEPSQPAGLKQRCLKLTTEPAGCPHLFIFLGENRIFVILLGAYVPLF